MSRSMEMNPSNPSLGGGLTGSESVLSGSGFVQSNMYEFGESGSGADGFVQSNMPLETHIVLYVTIDRVLSPDATTPCFP